MVLPVRFQLHHLHQAPLHKIDFTFRGCDAPFGLLLEHVQDVNRSREPHCIYTALNVPPLKSDTISSTPSAIPFRGFAFTGILPCWTRVNANPISLLTSFGSSRSISRESPMNRTGLIEVAVMSSVYNMLIVAYCLGMS